MDGYLTKISDALSVRELLFVVRKRSITLSRGLIKINIAQRSVNIDPDQYRALSSALGQELALIKIFSGARWPERLADYVDFALSLDPGAKQAERIPGGHQISWTGITWNPGIFGCTPVSPACDSCYAACTAHRGLGPYGKYTLTRLTDDGVTWTGDVYTQSGSPKRTALKLPKRKAALVFTTSMSDLWHPKVPRDFSVEIYVEMAVRPHLTFQTLTKHPHRMADAISDPAFAERVLATALWHPLHKLWRKLTWPLPNVWPGSTIEDARPARVARLRHLIRTPIADGALRFVSAEPMLEELDLSPASPGDIGHIILGGEAKWTRRDARELDLGAVRRTADAATGKGIAVTVKQLGTAWARKVGAGSRNGTDPAEWPADLSALYGLPASVAQKAGVA